MTLISVPHDRRALADCPYHNFGARAFVESIARRPNDRQNGLTIKNQPGWSDIDVIRSRQLIYRRSVLLQPRLKPAFTYTPRLGNRLAQAGRPEHDDLRVPCVVAKLKRN